MGALVMASGVAAARPWPARAPSVEPKPAHQLRDPATWPAEPDAPAPIDAAKFRAAYAHLCNVPVDSPRAALAPTILTAAAAAKSDPFTLAALGYYGSHCDPGFHKEGLYGLLAIDPSMYRVEGAPEPPVSLGDLTSRRLLDPADSLTVGAALLEMWNARHKELDGAFGGAPHRGGVAHFIWGDEVKSSGHEDLVLTARRRMIATYLGTPNATREAPFGITVVSPLEGIPRVATSGPGDERDGGARRHRGLDITATLGEPVRSIADGQVIFAGANVPGRARKGPIPPEKIARYATRTLGVGGIYLCIEHRPEPKRVVSCYMHLSSYIVEDRQQVKAGELIGYVGRTGVKVSPPHLHFEV
ncbi:MAG TPA: peptidoglycan DD-metalloendopeptidase family protein, partial [Polyangia bacterium]|nr:peptidoglycan DD-metalloendopeptidase family protein [Polyangia bacterium]